MCALTRDVSLCCVWPDEKRYTYIIPFAFLFALFGVTMSLLYSEAFGFVLCGLCWIQRVFLYSQVVIFGIATYRDDISVADIVIALSVLGRLFAIDQYLLQLHIPITTACLTSLAENCADPVISEFGFVTFPFVSFMLFCWQIALMLIIKICLISTPTKQERA